MTEEYIMGIMANAMRVGMILGAPCLIAAFVVGIAVSLFQTVTQIHEATLTFIPKILAIFLTLLLFGPFLLNTMLDFVRQMFLDLPNLVR